MHHRGWCNIIKISHRHSLDHVAHPAYHFWQKTKIRRRKGSDVEEYGRGISHKAGRSTSSFECGKTFVSDNLYQAGMWNGTEESNGTIMDVNLWKHSLCYIAGNEWGWLYNVRHCQKWLFITNTSSIKDYAWHLSIMDYIVVYVMRHGAVHVSFPNQIVFLTAGLLSANNWLKCWWRWLSHIPNIHAV